MVAEAEGSPAGVAQRKGDAMHVFVPQHVVRLLMGKGGKTVQHLQEETKCKLQLDDQFDCDGCMKTSRLVKIRSAASSTSEREAALELCAYAVEVLCAEDNAQSQWRLEEVLANGKNQLRERELAMALLEQQERAEQVEAREQGAVRQLARIVGDLFSEAAIRDALSKEQWSVDLAEERLFQERNSVPTPDDVSTAKTSESKLKAPHRIPDCALKPLPGNEPALSKAAMMIRAVCDKAKARAQGVAPSSALHRANAQLCTEQMRQQGCTKSLRVAPKGVRRAANSSRC